jgi:prephenate dehydrogenase
VHVAIVGLGLMGGSLGLALRDRAGAEVSGFDPDQLTREQALERGCVDTVHATIGEACERADLVIVCTPVAQLPSAIAAALDAAPAAATVTDIGSTKANVVRGIAAADRVRFIGGHPVCGSESRGPASARAEIFDGATYFLTPVAETDPGRYARLVSAVTAIGARPVAIAPGAHDRLVALTSHMPHVLANLLATQAAAGTIDGHDPLAAVGGSFRDMTRVAGANARIWVDIFLDNREALLSALAEHRRRLDDVVEALEAGDGGQLARWIGESAAARRRRDLAAYPETGGDLHTVRVHLADRPGSIAGITQALGAAQISIRDLTLRHRSTEAGGFLDFVVGSAEAADRAVEILDAQGYAAFASAAEQGQGDP